MNLCCMINPKHKLYGSYFSTKTFCDECFGFFKRRSRYVGKYSEYDCWEYKYDN